MASTGSDGSISQGPLGIAQEHSSFRKNMIDKARIANKTSGEVPFLSTMFTKSITKRPVTDYKFVGFENVERPKVITLAGAMTYNSDGTGTVAVVNASADLLVIGQLIANQSIQFEDSTKTYTKPTDVRAVKWHEVAEIVAKGVRGSNSTPITVKRIHALKGYTEASVTGEGTVLWATTDVVIRANFAGADSESYKTPVNVNPTALYNYVQDFRMPFGASERERNADLFVRQNIKADRSYNATWAFFQDMERAFLYDGWGIDTSMNAAEKTYSRSVLSVIPSANFKTVASTLKPDMDDFLVAATQKGSKSDKRILVCHPTALKWITQSLAPHITQEGLFGDISTGWTVPTYMDPLGGKYALMYSKEMSESVQGTADRFAGGMFIVNMSYVQYAYFVGKEEGNMDMHLDEGEGGSLSTNKREYIAEWRAIAGLDIGAWDHHFYGYFNF